MRFYRLLPLVMLLAVPARAHDARPAYLEINETSSGRFSVLWRTPVLSGMRLSVVLKLPPGSGLGIFLVARSVGWIAHLMEQYATATIIRPRARYVGLLPAQR